MAFWGVEVRPEEAAQLVLPAGKKLRLSQACLDTAAKARSKVSLRVKVGDGPALLLCTLKEGQTESLGLDLYFDSDCEWSVEGAASIHLTGYLQPKDDDGSDEEDEQQEDAAISQARKAAIDEIMARQVELVGQKRKAGEAPAEAEEPAAKKVAGENGATAAPAQAEQAQQDKSLVIVKDGGRRRGGRGRGGSGLPKVVLLCDFSAGGGSGGGAHKPVVVPPGGGAAGTDGAEGKLTGDGAPAPAAVAADGGDLAMKEEGEKDVVPAAHAAAPADWGAKSAWGAQAAWGGQQSWGGPQAPGGGSNQPLQEGSGGGGGGGGTNKIALYIG